MNPINARPDFTGVWELNLERSTLRGSAPKRVLMQIEHREPRLVQQIHLTNADGVEKRVTFAYETGAETTNSVGGAPARTSTRWEGQELVIESWVTTPCQQVHFKDHWSLSGDGRTLTMAHRDDDLAGQISLLEKRSPIDTSVDLTDAAPCPEPEVH
jgi:hypothetical protein